jgi:formylglycine-generating enzyme required for sulfatase activity
VLLPTAVEGGQGEFWLEVARAPQQSLLTLVKKLLPILSKTVDKRSALRDYIFLTFLANPLSVRVPKLVLEVMLKFVTPTQLPRLRWAVSLVMWVGFLGIVGSLLYVWVLPESSNLPEILNPQRGAFESVQEFQARRERLRAEYNQASSQGEARYQVGVASLKNYNAKAEKLFVTLEWQATWIKSFGLLKLGRVEMTSQVANSFWQNNSQKPLYVQVAVVGEQLKINRVGLTSDGQVWYITFPVLPEMVIIPAGQFRMGDIQGTGESDEQPVHSVSVKSLAMGRHEVTFEEYDYFAEQTGRDKLNDSGWGRGNRPVINVSWDDATAYAEWLSGLTGEQYRLPMEAEWEYAARAGTETDYWWGNEIGSNRANCDGCGSQWDNKLTAPVCSFVDNPFGLCDTVGNVWEWTCSEYEEKYSGKELECIRKNYANEEGSSKNRANDGGRRVIRGGAWFDIPRWVRASGRGRGTRAYRILGVGFRLVRM